jgi:hypothetical protein
MGEWHIIVGVPPVASISPPAVAHHRERHLHLPSPSGDGVITLSVEERPHVSPSAQFGGTGHFDGCESSAIVQSV